jgi:hypothetical protein
MADDKKDPDNNEALEVIVEDASTETKQEAAPQKVADAPEKKDDLEQHSESVKRRIDKLTFRLREAERREQAALDFAKSLKNEVDTYKVRTDTLDKSLVSEVDNRLKVQEQLAKDKLKAAIDMNDVDAQIEAQRMLAKLVVDSERLQAHQMSQRQRQAAPPPQQVQPAYTPPPPEPDQKAQSWAQRNQWFGNDEVMTLTAFSLHKKLVENEGFDPTSDDYYNELDRRIRSEFPHKFQQARNQTASTVASARPSSAPTGKKQVKLTPSQVSIANRLGVSLESYARQIQKLQG